MSDNISNIARSVWLAGLGAAVAGKEEADKLLDTVKQQGDETMKKLNKAAADVNEVKVAVEETFKEMVRDEVKSLISTLGLPQDEDVKEIHAQLNRIEKKLSDLTEKLSS